MTGLTLYVGNKNYSSWSMRPWMAMTAAGIDFEEVVIPFDFAAGILSRWSIFHWSRLKGAPGRKPNQERKADAAFGISSSSGSRPAARAQMR